MKCPIFIFWRAGWGKEYFFVGKRMEEVERLSVEEMLFVVVVDEVAGHQEVSCLGDG